MKKIHILSSILLLIALCAFKTTGDSSKLFKEMLNRAQMTFTKPDGFTEVPTIDNDQVGYQYAMKYKGKKFEVRYSIMPLDSLLKDYKESLKDTNKKVLEPNKLFGSMFIATVMNASMGSDGGMGDASSFDDDAVKSEFNADAGKVVRFSPGKEFGQDYKIGIMVGLHRTDIGDAYIFFLSDTKDGFSDLMKQALHALKFK